MLIYVLIMWTYIISIISKIKTNEKGIKINQTIKSGREYR